MSVENTSSAITTLNDLLDPSLVSSLDRLDLMSKKMLQGRMQGERRSRRRGRSRATNQEAARARTREPERLPDGEVVHAVCRERRDAGRARRDARERRVALVHSPEDLTRGARNSARARRGAIRGRAH